MAREIPSSIRELERYDFVILSDAPAEAAQAHASAAR